MSEVHNAPVPSWSLCWRFAFVSFTGSGVSRITTVFVCDRAGLVINYFTRGGRQEVRLYSINLYQMLFYNDSHDPGV